MSEIKNNCSLKYEKNVMDIKLYYCKHCGKVITMVNETITPTICCGDEMQLLEPGMTDGMVEKHVPVVSVHFKKVTVRVGEQNHPMKPEHYIQWVLLQTDRGFSLKELNPGDEPKVVFSLRDDESIVGVYSYCNIHKLWKSN